MTLLLNVCRVLLACVWTAIVGTPLLIALYARYWYGLLGAKLGRGDVLDRVLEANAWLAGWVAQKFWTSVILTLAGIRLRVREIVPIDWSKAHVICANHASIFDILALVRTIPPPFRFVAKRELLKWPIIGWALRPAGQIVIDRADRARALRSIAEAALRQDPRAGDLLRRRARAPAPGSCCRSRKAPSTSPSTTACRCCRPPCAAAMQPWRNCPGGACERGRQIEILFCGSIQPPAVPQLNGNRAVETLAGSDARHRSPKP